MAEPEALQSPESLLNLQAPKALLSPDPSRSQPEPGFPLQAQVMLLQQTRLV